MLLHGADEYSLVPPSLQYLLAVAMEHAWLNSLSEDWVSQPGSDSSIVQLPPLQHSDKSEPSPRQAHPSRIPRRSQGAKFGVSSANDSNINILSERSANDINITRQKLPTKLSQDTKASHSGTTSRSVSAASDGSVIHNTVQHQDSPSRRGKTQTPEWKRRLIYGDVQYGEQRDLFSSAAAGLQDMFKPPALEDEEDFDGINEHHETTMPSSPPQYPPTSGNHEMEEETGLDDDEEPEFPDQVTPSPSPRKAQREVRYKLNPDESMNSSQFSTLSMRRSTTSFRRNQDGIFRDESCLSVSSPVEATVRKTSGQSDTRNEDFSAILIGKHSDEDGKVDFAPIEMPAEQLRQRLERLRISQMLLDSEVDPEMCFEEATEDPSALIETTDDYMRNGGFINLRRGGRSGEGSFRYRALSPDLGVDSSEMLSEESLQASTPKQFPTLRSVQMNSYQSYNGLKSPSMPRAPFPSPEKRQYRDNITEQGGGSPLKLFGPYDTFTNQTLLRRISQFEEGMSGRTSRQSLDAISHGDHNDSLTPSATPNPQRVQEGFSTAGSRVASQFGVGDLEGYEFSGDISSFSDELSGFPGKENISPKLFFHDSIDELPDSTASLIEGSELQVRRRRHKSLSLSSTKHIRVLSAAGQLRHSLSPPKGAHFFAGSAKRDAGSEGKRPRTSPSKDPTPKRRRTLHRSDIAFGREDQMAAVDIAHRKIQLAMGKKRKDARPGHFELANPEILALRSILRPRSPTPSQKSSPNHRQHSSPEDKEEGQVPMYGKPRKSPTRTAKHEHAQLHNNFSADADRKPSIRTQDFVDQAAQIMAMIRNQVSQPGLASLEESEAENVIVPNEDLFEDSSEESTDEPFSRPPSRDGKPVSRIPLRQEDPELVDRLRKYQELSDMGDIISSSLRSMNLANDAIRVAREIERQLKDEDRSGIDRPFITDGEIISDIPNIRISVNPATNGESISPVRDFPSHSSGRSTSRTYPTASSRGSDSRRVIMPESVSHLIPDRIGGMYLDKQNNIWIKKKEIKVDSDVTAVTSDESEADPFASIPDLTVDMTRELQNLRVLPLKGQGAPTSIPSLEEESSSIVSNLSKTQSPRGYVTLAPGEELDPFMAARARGELVQPAADMPHSPTQEIKGGIDVNNDTISNPTSTTRRRNLTISFSSPIASVIRDVSVEDLDSLEDDPATEDLRGINATPNASPSQTAATRAAAKGSGQGPTRTHNRAASRQASVRGQSFVPRPVSRIDEQDEDSTVEIQLENDRQLSIIGENSLMSQKTPDPRTGLSFIFNHTPRNTAMAVHGDDNGMIGQNIGKLSLSPLSEFTLNNIDQSFGFEISYVMGPRHMATGNGTKRVMSMTIRALVDKLSEVEPFEPYWEDMTELDLHDKHLTSLHMLDEFCGKVVTLDASHNALGHLDGVPSAVRQLKVSHNMLTELTSWDHLMNLQYVDISGNEVKSLSALKNLVHLRSVRADNNRLTSLGGLDCHDGLLSLRARDNLMEELDCSEVNLKRLTELDLANNRITAVKNMGSLTSLSKLNLAKNHLRTFDIDSSLKTLRQLDLSDNELISLNLANLPNLHTLHVDRNRIQELAGFSRARRLDSLSLREQRGKVALNLSFLTSACEVRKLFLSGNYLGTFSPRVDLLNLQLLELANCGLQNLPENLGQLMPNLRTLNLNYNAVSDLSPLRFIPRLKKLLVSGNRLMDSTSVTELLTDFPHLARLDLRDNPITQGFYPPVQVLVSKETPGGADPFAYPDADAERDSTFASRLDEATKLRRRLHEVVFVASCKRLRMLDGLPIRRKSALARDSVLETLIAEGLVPELEDTLVAGSEATPPPEKESVPDFEPEAVEAQARHGDTVRSSSSSNSRWSHLRD